MGRIKPWVAAGILGAAIAIAAPAASAEEETLYRFDLPAQPLAEALRAIARQTGANVLFESKDLSGIQTKELKGQLTTSEAIERVLEGTKLEAQRTAPTTVIVQPTAASSSARTVLSEPHQIVRLAQGPSPSQREGRGEVREQVAGGQRVEDSAQPRQGVELEEIVVEGIPEVLVIGKRTLNMDIERTRDDAQPYVVLARETIEQSAAATLEQFLRDRLPQSTNGLQNGQQNSFAGMSSTINLRGLGAQQTLILIDGHRMVNGPALGSAPFQPDMNGIPLSAVERIEVLPATASGIYGGGATGGVINIILRHDYDGSDVKLTYGNSFDGDARSRRVDLAQGMNFNDDKTNISLFCDLSLSRGAVCGKKKKGRWLTALSLCSYLIGATHLDVDRFCKY